MLADCFTKPLQGHLFKLFREIIMGWKFITILLDKIALKERVEDQDILPRIEARNIVEDQDNKNVSEITPIRIDDVSNGK